jgi:hypothetical protein
MISARTLHFDLIPFSVTKHSSPHLLRGIGSILVYFFLDKFPHNGYTSPKIEQQSVHFPNLADPPKRLSTN